MNFIAHLFACLHIIIQQSKFIDVFVVVFNLLLFRQMLQLKQMKTSRLVNEILLENRKLLSPNKK